MTNIYSLVRFRRNNKYGLKYKFSNHIILQPYYHDIRRIRNTDLYMKVRMNQKWGIINCMGKCVVDTVYDEILVYDDFGFLAVKNNRKFFISISKKRGSENVNNSDSENEKIYTNNRGFATHVQDDHWDKENNLGWDWNYS